ncbi:hypothetical protein A2U01_0093806, partial [Trifolium medium]|nr:hypothetical protein [Trifolium medium]
MARCARAEHEEWISSANCAPRRKDCASRQQVKRKIESFCHLR